jgi:hypothetical protein
LPSIFRLSLRVGNRPDNGVIEAVTYTVIPGSKKNNIQTSLDYVRLIVQGLREHGVSDGYIGRVKTIAMANNPKIAKEISDL